MKHQTLPLIMGFLIAGVAIDSSAVLPPKYLGIENFKQCTGTQDIDTYTVICMPAGKPAICPETSWEQLNALSGRDKIPDCPSNADLAPPLPTATSVPGAPPRGLIPGGGPKVADTSWIKTKHIGVAYAGKSATQQLDLYLPNEGAGPFPLIIEIHGGGFIMGSKSGDIAPMLEGLKSRYAVASINYRLSGEARFPAAINDVKAAIRFLRANAEKYNLNPGKFAVWGGSAGGHLAALAAVSGDINALYDPTLGHADVSDKVQAAVDWFGPIYFATMDAEFTALGTSGQMGPTNSINSAESKYLGKLIGTPVAQPLIEAASPLTYISKDDPPIYIQHGTRDRNIPITQSINFSNKLAEVIGKEKVIFEPVEGAGHGGEQFNSPENAAKIIDFLNKALKPD